MRPTGRPTKSRFLAAERNAKATTKDQEVAITPLVTRHQKKTSSPPPAPSIATPPIPLPQHPPQPIPKPSTKRASPVSTKSTPTRTSLVDRQQGPSPASIARRKAATLRTKKPTPTKSPRQPKLAKTSTPAKPSSHRKTTPNRLTPRKTPRETQPPGTTPVDSVRDLHERLSMAQTQALQYLFVSSKLTKATVAQTESGHRQIYAVWRATEQAHQVVASIETLLSAANTSRARHQSLLNEARALRQLGAATAATTTPTTTSTTSTTPIEQEHKHKRDVLESNTRAAQQEFKQFANALSSSLSWIPVTNMTALESSQNGNLDLAMEQFAQTTSRLEKALSNEFSSAAALSKEWDTLASTVEASTKLLAEQIQTMRGQETIVQAGPTTASSSRADASDASFGLANAFNRTSRAIDNLQ